MKLKFLGPDDHQDIADLISFHIEEGGFIDETYSKSDAFLEKVETFNPDLIMLDILLPDGNGFEIFTKLRNNEDTMNIPTIFISVKEEDKTKGLKMGESGFIVKPFTETEIKSTIKDLIGVRK